MRVRFSPRARDDLRSIFEYLDQRSLIGARNLRQAIRQGVSLIARHPHLGAPAGEGITRVIPIGRYPYLVYWTVARGLVIVLHIRHAARERPGEEMRER